MHILKSTELLLKGEKLKASFNDDRKLKSDQMYH